MLTLLHGCRSFVVPVAASLVLAACGGSSTNPPVGNSFGPPGYMTVTLTVAAPANPKYRYLIVFNATGNGRTPQTPGEPGGKGSLATYSYAVTSSDDRTGFGVEAGEYLRAKNCAACLPAYVALLSTPGQLQLIPNGTGAELTFIFDRKIFASTEGVWLFNAFTQNKTGASIDSMGGRCSTCFVSPQLPVSGAFEDTIAAKPGAAKIDPAAAIVRVQITNEP